MPGFLKQEIEDGLWVVATPIGNLSDLSERAKIAMEEADVILCEDTRRTAKLMSSLGLKKHLERLDAHASKEKIKALTEEILRGKNMVLVSDAGTPALSDPGSYMISYARLCGVCVTPIPGPSAITALLSVAGFTETSFTFCGFFPRKEKDRKAILAEASSCKVSEIFVWFESPERIVEAFEVIAEIPMTAEMVVGKELTKIYEKIFSGSARELLEQVKTEIETQGAVGEWTFAIWFKDKKNKQEEANSLDWVKTLHCLLDAGIGAPEAARQVSQHFGAKKRDVYELALNILQKK